MEDMIKEREEYEKEFFSGILDEIIEREEYEKKFFSRIVDEMIEEEEFDLLISKRMDYINEHFDFEPSPEYEYLEQLYYAEHDEKFQKERSDVFDYIDYPEGPCENIEGIRHEPYFDDIEIEEGLQYVTNDEIEVDCDNTQDYDSYIGEYDDSFDRNFTEESMDSLIDIHLEEEKNFLESIITDAVHDVIIDESYFEKAIDEFIFDNIEIDYEPDFFDYDEMESWQYSGETYPPDESLTDPFDTFGEIDYPEGNPDVYEIPHDEEKRNTFFENRDELYLKFKNHIKEDDSLNRIVKEKVKEKKFDR